MRYFTERREVQEAIISVLSQPTASYSASCWRYLTQEEVNRLRRNTSNIVLRDVFFQKVKELNPFLSQRELEELLKRIESLKPNIQGNMEMWEHLKGIRSIYVEKERRERNIRLIDTENWQNNVFHYTDEFEFSNGIRKIRQDLVFFINGIPLVFIEAKAPHREDAIESALAQVRRYHEEASELLAVEQVFGITHAIRFLYGATWNTSSKSLYNFREEIKGGFEELIRAFFGCERVVRLLSDYVLFVRKDDRLEKVLLRPHQIRAVEKSIQRAKDPDKHKGLIWHTQGSGKTYTMLAIAKRLIEDPVFENPTVLMLVDRNELEQQLFSNIKAVGLERVEIAESKRYLQELLRQDRRGIIVSTIHKFEGMPENINTRHNIIVLVDEAHRTMGGKLGNYLMGALPNATYLGFTGTPIGKTSSGKSTFHIFGIDDPEGYLDKYSIAQSIEDGTTLRLYYNLAPNELKVDRETLEKEFLELKDAEGISDPWELDTVLEKAVHLKNMLKSQERISRVAEYVARHYREYVEPLGYKAFLVAVDREACALYKEELDKHLPPEYSRVVFSPHKNDPPIMQRFHLSEEEEKRVREDFKDPEKMPKILIVTNKLLTGFDAPVLYCLYLDKPMRDHMLLQTIARVNRPYEDKEGRKKPAGLIIDFVGIFENLEKALAFDSVEIEGVATDLELLKERFKELMEKAQKEYLQELSSLPAYRRVDYVLEKFHEEARREEFYKFCREVFDLYDLLSPDAFLRPYLDHLENLRRVYAIVRQAYEPSYNISRDFSKKVEELVRKHTKQSMIGESLEVYEINEGLLKRLEAETADHEKVFNLARTIEEFVRREKDKNPLFVSIGERAQQVVEDFKRRQIKAQEALRELRKLIEETLKIQTQIKESQLDMETFAIAYKLKESGKPPEEAETLAKEIRKLLDGYPYWKQDEGQERELKRHTLRLLKDMGLVEDILKVLR
ncbi:type I restriction endonuclease subunit R [Hydrogenobacter sp. Uz 6-8]|uniref:type I restriction endonuclease subunit R n=1 Tax=Hydrogenobacter sp. Uz 6-8 TaxID=3384828 RepID=UPI0038FC3366